MSYKSKSIREIIKEIESSKVYLPALQRKFVWGKYQIETLFDSIMRNYPIGTFLFWNLKKEVANNYVFYEFLKEYDQRSPYNRRMEASFLNDEIIGVLDGQQRLSSMYIALQGTHTEKARYMRKSNEDAYKKSRLYLNLLSLPYFITEENVIKTDDDLNFEFKFLSDLERKEWIYRKSKVVDEAGHENVIEENMFWFRVGDVLTWGEDPEYDIIIDFLKSSTNSIKQKEEIEERRRIIRKALQVLYARIYTDKLINYFEISKEDLEDILKIFIRVNSGGTQLNKTDLLFSTIVATWDNGREEIEDSLRRINQKGDGFAFNNEYLMRCCLVLTDAPVLYKVNSFKSENVQKIKEEWPKIASALDRTVDLLVEFGFNSSLLTSLNSTIIIAYYIYKGGNISDKIKFDIKKYLIHALLKGIYGSSQDQLISALRNALRVPNYEKDGFILKDNNFKFDDLLKVELPSRKSLYISEADLETFMSYRKSPSSFFVLSLLYPNLRYKEVQFHQDHIHPFSRFTTSVFDALGLTPEERERWNRLRDMVPNLQLLEGRQNESKNAAEFFEWVSRKDESTRQYFLISNYMPEGISLQFSEFITFFEMRKHKLKEELKRVLAINSEPEITLGSFLDSESELEESFQEEIIN